MFLPFVLIQRKKTAWDLVLFIFMSFWSFSRRPAGQLINTVLLAHCGLFFSKQNQHLCFFFYIFTDGLLKNFTLVRTTALILSLYKNFVYFKVLFFYYSVFFMPSSNCSTNILLLLLLLLFWRWCRHLFSCLLQHELGTFYFCNVWYFIACPCEFFSLLRFRNNKIRKKKHKFTYVDPLIC